MKVSDYHKAVNVDKVQVLGDIRYQGLKVIQVTPILDLETGTTSYNILHTEGRLSRLVPGDTELSN